MGTKERRERDKTRLRQRILDAAQRIIAHEGFSAMTMRKLAERIEYSPAAIYLHFKSREEIARELTEIGFGKLLKSLQEAAAGKDPVRRIHGLAQAYVRFGVDNPETYRLIFTGDAAYVSAAFESQDPDSAANRAWALLVEAARSLVRTSPLNHRKKPEEVAQLLWASLHGIVSLHLSCTGFRGASPETLTQLATEFLVKGLGLKAST